MPAKGNPDRQSSPDSGSVVLIIFEQGQSFSVQAGLAMLFLVKHEKDLAASNWWVWTICSWVLAWSWATKFSTPDTCHRSCWWSWRRSEWGSSSA
jgi:hypothetical protein